MKILRYALLGLIFLTLTAASRPPTTPKDNFAATVSRLQDEVELLASEEEASLYKSKKILVETNILLEDIDKVIRKIDSHEITYWNDEIVNIYRRIDDLHDESDKHVHKGDDLRHRHIAIECELDANPRLRRLVSVGGLQEKIHKFNSFADEYNQQVLTYNDRVDDFKSRTNKLPKR